MDLRFAACRVNAYCGRHLKQGPGKEVENSKWRYSLMNWQGPAAWFYVLCMLSCLDVCNVCATSHMHACPK